MHSYTLVSKHTRTHTCALTHARTPMYTHTHTHAAGARDRYFLGPDGRVVRSRSDALAKAMREVADAGRLQLLVEAADLERRRLQEVRQYSLDTHYDAARHVIF
jgi:hypothetical protein